MATEATGSKFSRNNSLIAAGMCLAFGLYFGYDGWFGKYRQKELDSNDGKPTPNLYFNQYVPIPLALIAIYSFLSAAKAKNRKLIADERGLTLSASETIAYNRITHIDERRFKKDGFFLVRYKDNDQKKEVKLTDRQYDNLGVLLDELIKQTGAQPEGADESAPNE